MAKSIPNRPVPHGTHGGYSHYKCRCEPCSAAASEYHKAHYRRNRERKRVHSAERYAAEREQRKERQRAWYAANREREQVAARKRHADDPHRDRKYAQLRRDRNEPIPHGTVRAYAQDRCRCPDCKAAKAESAKLYRQKNQYVVVARRQAYWQDNREKILVRNNQWASANRTRIQANDVRAVTPRDWRRLCARYDNCCVYCKTAAKLTQDHVIPLVRGGRHAIGNLLPACHSCNSRKRHRFIMEWRLARGDIAA